ncbi:MAG TPA: hypothetical protein VGU27_12155 [Candidatus Eisenbacteria bacterium]|nr:hypothetical protein [Candidatus Eisenbacteria bacterium]
MSDTLDPRSHLGRAVFQMLDVSVRLKPDIRGVVIRVHNAIAAKPKDPGLRFTLRRDVDFLSREPRLAGIMRQLWKALPQS